VDFVSVDNANANRDFPVPGGPYNSTLFQGLSPPTPVWQTSTHNSLKTHEKLLASSAAHERL